jgi:hypothetical protein
METSCCFFPDNSLFHRTLTFSVFNHFPENSGIITVGGDVFLSFTTVLLPSPFWAIGLSQRLARTISHTDTTFNTITGSHEEVIAGLPCNIDDETATVTFACNSV